MPAKKKKTKTPTTNKKLSDSGKLSKFTETNGWEMKGISTCPSQERRTILYIT